MLKAMEPGAGEWARFLWPLLALVAALGAVAFVGEITGPPALAHSVTEALILVVVVVGLYMFIGISGIFSFGHISFMAVGAYAAAWQTCCPALKPLTMHGLPDFLQHTTVPNLPADLMAGGFAAVIALLSGSILLRLTVVGASIGTMALLFIVYITYSNWQSVTLGKGSIIGLPNYLTPAMAYAWAVAALTVAYFFQESRLGLQLRASREDETAARALGVKVYILRLTAFVLSAFVVGIGGALYAHFLGTVSIDIFFLDMTFMTLAMLVIGGMRSLAGAVVGVATLSIITDGLRMLERGVVVGHSVLAVPSGTQEVALAIAMLLILMFRPRGITGGQEIPWPRTWRKAD